MTLDHVGSYAGPDLATLARLRERAPHGTQLIGAGGIRHRDDLRLAQASGAHAWLVASALHDRRLDQPAVA
jgi:phosphoribosylformimino-5-aminoimidazole carboxamide ribotide isomerase